MKNHPNSGAGMLCYGLCLFLTLFPALMPVALACRYSVRDVAFVDLSNESYQLLVITPENPIKKDRDDWQNLLSRTLRDTNLTAKTVMANEGDGSTRKLLQTHGIQNLPAAILVHPDGRSLPVLHPQDFSDLSRLANKAKQLADNPISRQVIDLALKHHSLILLVAGSDSVSNGKARTVCQTACQVINGTLPLLPKKIDHPPVVLELSTEQQGNVPALLWALGLSVKRQEDPRMVVLFGRGRKIGTVIDLANASKQLPQFMHYVGQDCECELDRSIMRTPMIPHGWDHSCETKAAQLLKFDPGSPLVQAEISRILARGPVPGNVPTPTPTSVDPFGYQEFSLDDPPLVPANKENTASPGSTETPLELSTESESKPSPPTITEEVEFPPGRQPASILLYFFGGLILFMILGSVIILRLYRRRR